MGKRLTSKICVTIMAIVCVFSSVACGGGTRSGKITLEFVHYWPEHAQFLRQICQDFSAENPDITIKPTNVPYSNIEKQLNGMLVAGGLPDVFCFWSNQSYNFAKNGYLADLDGFVEKEKDNYVNQAFSLEDGKINGHYYAAPFRATGYVIVYNKTMFELNGWEVPDTLEKLETLCYDIVDANVGLTPLAVYGTSSGTMMQIKSTFDEYINILTGLVNDPAYYFNRQDASEEPELEQLYADSLVRLKAWYDAGFFTLAPMTRDNAEKEFTNANTPMILFNNNNLDVLQKTIGDSFEIGAISFPSPEIVQDLNFKTYTNGTFDSVFIAKSTKNYGAALKFVEYLMSDEVQQAWVDKTRSVSLKSNVDYKDEEQRNMAKLLSQIGSYPQKPDFVLSVDAAGKNYNLISNYLTGSGSKTAIEVVREGFANKVKSVTDEMLNPGNLNVIPITTALNYEESRFGWIK